MTVPFTFSTGATISASQVNSNFTQVESDLSAIEADQLLGQITADKLTDRYSITTDTVTLINPYTAETPASSATNVLKWEPIFKPGKAAFLAYIKVYVVEADTGGTDASLIDFRVNGSTVLGSSSVSLDTDDTMYIVGTADPLAAPLYALSEGDYIQVRHWYATGTPVVRGLFVTFAMKHVLIP